MKLNNKEYKIKVTLRAMVIFEQIASKPFEISNTLDQFVYFYSLLLANNPECNMTFDDFLDSLDEDPNALMEFKKILEDYNKRMSSLNRNNDESSSEDNKKKS